MKTAQTIAQQEAKVAGEKSAKTPKRKMHPNSLKNLCAPWKPGECPNPGGRPKDYAGVISRAIIELNAEEIYRAGVAKLLAGDAYAFSVHADRGYGKLKQGLVHMGDEEGGPIQASIKVEFVNPGPNVTTK